MVADDQIYHEKQPSDKYVEGFSKAFKTGVQISASPPNQKGMLKASLFDLVI